MDLGLEGRVAVVTGASKGIGLAVVQALVAEGAAVVAGARTTAALVPLEGVTAVAVDLAGPGGPEALVAAARERHGRLDVLVNNVGGAPVRPGGFLSVADDDFEASLQLNFFSALRAMRAALPAMREAGGGAIVNVASVNAYLPDPLVIDYGAAKAALLNTARALAEEVASEGIRVNSVSPGPVATDLWLGPDGVAATVGRSAGVDPAAVREQATAGIATGRFSTPDEVATLVLLLASPRTANVTGSSYAIDGGLVKTL
jgi:NAD(P)-dependent dehydrogenase (short-subunit alcohol dehydrogenase family)